MKVAQLANVAAPLLPTVVKVENVAVHFQPDHESVIHSVDCQHQNGRDEVSYYKLSALTSYTDDYYYVAPCAKKAN